MKLHINLKRAIACVAAILPVVILAVTANMHEHAHYASCMNTNGGQKLIHHTAPVNPSHIVGWVNHLVGPFTSIAANL